jgi:uncharacterized damage-inducible protein DinB
MMNAELDRDGLLVLCDYNTYANQKVLDAASRLDEDQINHDFKMCRCSVGQTLQHMLDAEVYFLRLCQDEKYAEMPAPKAGRVVNYWGTIPEETRSFLEKQGKQDLQREVQVQFGEHSFSFPVWQMMAQVFNHSMIHRGELSIFMTELGQPLPDLDILIHFVKESGQSWPFEEEGA